MDCSNYLVSENLHISVTCTTPLMSLFFLRYWILQSSLTTPTEMTDYFSMTLFTNTFLQLLKLDMVGGCLKKELFRHHGCQTLLALYAL